MTPLDKALDQTGNYNSMEPTPIIKPDNLRQIADLAYETARAARKEEAIALIPLFNALLTDAVNVSMTHVENTITIPQEMLEKICEPQGTWRESVAYSTEYVTTYTLEKLNMVGEALFRMIKDEGYKIDVFRFNEMTVYA